MTTHKNVPAAARRAPGDRTDGISKLIGTVTFASDGVCNLDLTVDAGEGDSAVTYNVTGNQGTSILASSGSMAASFTPASTDANGNRVPAKVTARGLGKTPQAGKKAVGGKAAAGKDYTVQFSYTAPGETEPTELEGTVAKADVVLGSSADITVN